MDAQQLITEFLASAQGGQAAQALADQGIDADTAQQMLAHVAQAAHDHSSETAAAPAEGHGGTNFFAAFAAGIVRGDGLFKSLLEGGEGVLTGRVAETLAARMGIDPATASNLAAAATPYVVSFLRQRFA